MRHRKQITGSGSLTIYEKIINVFIKAQITLAFYDYDNTEPTTPKPSDYEDPTTNTTNKRRRKKFLWNNPQKKNKGT
jgi:hypothetical protein